MLSHSHANKVGWPFALALGCCFPPTHLDTDTVVPPRGQQVVHNLEAGRALGEVHCRDVHQALELGVDVVPQEIHERD